MKKKTVGMKKKNSRIISFLKNYEKGRSKMIWRDNTLRKIAARPQKAGCGRN